VCGSVMLVNHPGAISEGSCSAWPRPEDAAGRHAGKMVGIAMLGSEHVALWAGRATDDVAVVAAGEGRGFVPRAAAPSRGHARMFRTGRSIRSLGLLLRAALCKRSQGRPYALVFYAVTRGAGGEAP
jgi:hypothetical protein